MEIPIPGKTVFILRRDPGRHCWSFYVIIPSSLSSLIWTFKYPWMKSRAPRLQINCSEDLKIIIVGAVMAIIPFWSKVNIWNVNCAWATAFIFETNRCSCESVKVFETENVSTWGGHEPPTFGFMLNALTIWAIRARHLLPMFFNTGSGGIDIF